MFSIFAFVDVPIVIFSIKWWRTQHPQPVFWGGGSFPPDWKAVFGWQMLAVMLVGMVSRWSACGRKSSSGKSIRCAVWRMHCERFYVTP